MCVNSEMFRYQESVCGHDPWVWNVTTGSFTLSIALVLFDLQLHCTVEWKLLTDASPHGAVGLVFWATRFASQVPVGGLEPVVGVRETP